MNDPLFSRWEQRQARASDQRDTGWLDAYFEAIGERLGDFFEWLFDDRSPSSRRSGGGGSAGSGMALAGVLKVLGWVLLIVVVGLMLWMLLGWWTTQGRVGRPAAPSRAALDSALEKRDALAADAEQWAAHAQALAEERDLRQAFRAMFLSLLSGLHSAGHIRYRAQRTNWAYVRGFNGPDTQRDAFRRLTSRFDNVWYGHDEPRPDEFPVLQQQVASLLRTERSAAGGTEQ
ncbi:MAG: DUF4129 domain-containing protein [Planctomycetota bacterium]